MNRFHQSKPITIISDEFWWLCQLWEISAKMIARWLRFYARRRTWAHDVCWESFPGINYCTKTSVDRLLKNSWFYLHDKTSEKQRPSAINSHVGNLENINLVEELIRCHKNAPHSHKIRTQSKEWRSFRGRLFCALVHNHYLDVTKMCDL